MKRLACLVRLLLPVMAVTALPSCIPDTHDYSGGYEAYDYDADEECVPVEVAEEDVPAEEKMIYIYLRQAHQLLNEMEMASDADEFEYYRRRLETVCDEINSVFDSTDYDESSAIDALNIRIRDVLSAGVPAPAAEVVYADTTAVSYYY